MKRLKLLIVAASAAAALIVGLAPAHALGPGFPATEAPASKPVS